MPELPAPPARILDHARFQLQGELGQGGVATVYRARDLDTGEIVALKLLHEDLLEPALLRTRLEHELAAVHRLDHPHILKPAEIVELEGRLALRLPFHPGQTLAERVARLGPLSTPDLHTLASQLAAALEHSHRHEVLHRDVTPHNVMLEDSGDAVLTDFGLAFLDDVRAVSAPGIQGTCGYAAPETWQGVRTDPRSDLYSLGATLYFAATGKGPFSSRTPYGVLQRQLDGDMAPLTETRPDLPAGLAALIDKLLSLDPGQRPPGGSAVVARLGALEGAIEGAGPVELVKEALERGNGKAGKTGKAGKAPIEGGQGSEGAGRVSGRLPVGDQAVILKRARTRFFSGQATVLSQTVLALERIREELAREIGLPADALMSPAVENVLPTGTPLVTNVSPGCAERVAAAARAAGLEVTVVDDLGGEEWYRRRNIRNRWAAFRKFDVAAGYGLLLIFVSTYLMTCGQGVPDPSGPWSWLSGHLPYYGWSTVGLLFSYTVMAAVLFPHRFRSQAVFPADLSPLVRPQHRSLLEAGNGESIEGDGNLETTALLTSDIHGPLSAARMGVEQFRTTLGKLTDQLPALVQREIESSLQQLTVALTRLEDECALLDGIARSDGPVGGGAEKATGSSLASGPGAPPHPLPDVGPDPFEEQAIRLAVTALDLAWTADEARDRISAPCWDQLALTRREGGLG